MKPTPSFKKITVDIICLLYVLLFVYAAVSKLIDFENFQVQLGQSPLLGAFAGVLVWAVPIAEIVISVLLLIKPTKYPGLLLSFCLMTCFSAYIYIILNFSESIPCSCGGILEKLGWKEHLWFNVFFVVLSAIGIWLTNNWNRSKAIKYIALLATGSILSIGLIVMLYFASTKITRYSNTFIRNFPMAANKVSELDLGYNSYYFAGSDPENIYLGNITAPLQVLSIDKITGKISNYRIALDRTNLPFRAVKVKLIAPYFYLYDGTLGCIYRGKIADWRAYLKFRENVFIDQLVPTDSTTVIARTQDAAHGTRMSIINVNNGGGLAFKAILKKQTDGIFDVDGTLVFDETLGRAIYIYSYRNMFIVTDNRLNIVIEGNTIDTIAHPNIEIKELKERGQLKLAKPPLKVNRSAASHRGLLFVHSGIIGRYESEKMWKVASIVDVYRLSDKSYVTSLYVHDVKGKKMSSFIVSDDKLYALVGNALATYKLSTIITSRYAK